MILFAAFMMIAPIICGEKKLQVSAPLPARTAQSSGKQEEAVVTNQQIIDGNSNTSTPDKSVKRSPSSGDFNAQNGVLPGEENADGNGERDVDYNVNVETEYPEFKGKIEVDKVRIELEKPTMGCTDLLMGPQTFSDPAVNAAFAYVYSLCLMEMVMQRYLKSEKYMMRDMKGLIYSANKALSQLQKILPAYLLGLQVMIDGFKDGYLRKVLDEGRVKYGNSQKGY